MSLGFLRFALAFILITPFLLVSTKKTKIKLEHLPRFLLAGLTLITFNIFFLYEGLQRTTSINASVLSMLIPVISVVLCWAFLREKIYWINLLGITFGFIGVLIIMGLPLIFIGNFDTSNLFGNLLIIISSTSTVIGSIFSKKLLKNYSTTTVTAAVFLIGAITFAVPAVNEYLSHPEWTSKITILGVLGLLYLSVLSSVSAYFLFEWGLDKTDINQANLFQYLQPAITATLAVPLLGERLSYSFIVGTILVVLGVYWGTLGKVEHHHPHHRHHRT